MRDALTRAEAARATAEAANRSKDEFLATLSHELRSPLGSIFMWVELLRSGRLDEARKRQALDAVDRSVQLQMRLIDDLLDVSRIISGKMVLDVGAVDLAATVEGAIESVRTAAQVARRRCARRCRCCRPAGTRPSAGSAAPGTELERR